VSLPATYVSDTGVLAETAATPIVRLYEVARGARSWVAEKPRVLPDDEAVVRALAMPTAIGLDPRREALMTAADARALGPIADARAGRAEVVRAAAGRLDIRAEGPGLLVVSEGWDPGWSAEVDERATPIARVNHAEMGVPLGPGIRRIVLSYEPPGLVLGTLLFALGALGILVPLARGGRARRS
jgi:hypothetical protein